MRKSLVISGLLLALVAPGSQASSPGALSVSAGRSISTDHQQLWTNVLFVDGTGATRRWHGLHWQPAWSLGWIQGRGRAGVDSNLKRDVVVAAAGARVVDWWGGAFFSFQLAAASRHTDAISSTAQFVSSLGWQGHHMVVMLRHVSNGDLFAGPNLG
ncbi:MAG: lipid A 3-O-deacylase [Rhodanobacteraceae bacterium]